MQVKTMIISKSWFAFVLERLTLRSPALRHVGQLVIVQNRLGGFWVVGRF